MWRDWMRMVRLWRYVLIASLLYQSLRVMLEAVFSVLVCLFIGIE